MSKFQKGTRNFYTYICKKKKDIRLELLECSTARSCVLIFVAPAFLKKFQLKIGYKLYLKTWTTWNQLKTSKDKFVVFPLFVNSLCHTCWASWIAKATGIYIFFTHLLPTSFFSFGTGKLYQFQKKKFELDFIQIQLQPRTPRSTEIIVLIV